MKTTTGSRYQEGRDPREIAKLIRADLKASRRFDGVEFSVRVRRFAGGCSIDVSIVNAPGVIVSLAWNSRTGIGYHSDQYSRRARELLADVSDVVLAYNTETRNPVDNSCTTNFYFSVGFEPTFMKKSFQRESAVFGAERQTFTSLLHVDDRDWIRSAVIREMHPTATEAPLWNDLDSVERDVQEARAAQNWWFRAAPKAVFAVLCSEVEAHTLAALISVSAFVRECRPSAQRLFQAVLSQRPADEISALANALVAEASGVLPDTEGWFVAAVQAACSANSDSPYALFTTVHYVELGTKNRDAERHCAELIRMLFPTPTALDCRSARLNWDRVALRARELFRDGERVTE